MSTRCMIAVEGSPVLIYKHSDGYPSGVLPTLLPQVRFFATKRGADAEYSVAQIVRAFALEEKAHDDSQRDRMSADMQGYIDESRRTLGWGLDVRPHGDLDYFYVVSDDGTVTIHSGRFPEYHDGFPKDALEALDLLRQRTPIAVVKPNDDVDDSLKRL